jgi:hypothetical protein
MDDCLQLCEEDTGFEQEWYNIKKYTTENSESKLREDKRHTQKEVLKDLG